MSPVNSYVEILMPKLMILGGGAFGVCLGHKNGVLINGIFVIIKESQSSLAPPTMWGQSKKVAVCNLEPAHAGTLILQPHIVQNLWERIGVKIFSLRAFCKHLLRTAYGWENVFSISTLILSADANQHGVTSSCYSLDVWQVY